MIKNGTDKSRGFVLLVALGVLGVLGLLAATFATLSRVERAVSNSYVDKVRAKMLAQSGIERAIASIRGRAMIQAWDDNRNDWYYREMLNVAAGGLTYTPEALAIWAPFVPNRLYGMPARNLETALDDGIVNGKPGGISFPDVTNKAISGSFPGTYEPFGDVYALKVLDCASMLNVNDGNLQIVRVLNNLGSLLKCSDGSLVSTGGFQLGTQIQTRAMARGKPFNNKSEVLDEVFVNNPFFGGAVAEARKRFDAVKDYITCHGWVDGYTPRFENTWTGATDWNTGNYSSAISGPSSGGGSPGGSGGSAEVGGAEEAVKAAPAVPEFATSPMYTLHATLPGAYASLPTTRVLAAPAPAKAKDPKKGGGFKQYVTGQGKNAGLGGETAVGKFGGTYYYIEPRTPININTASREVIVATLMDLQADFWDYKVVNEAAKPKEYEGGNLTLISVTITKAQAEAVADTIISARYTNGTPAGAWAFNDWMHFEDEVIHFIPGLSRFQKALIKANANPNSQIKKLCPDLILVQSEPSVNPDELVRMDKSDVKQYSTDWSFSSNGFFEIECIGRVYNSGKIMAEEKIETVVKVFDVLRYTTQEQFEQDRTWTTEDSKEGDLMAGGYPPVISMPEYVYNAAGNPIHYKSGTGDITWAADYEGYLVLNGPAKVIAGTTPGPAKDGGSAGGWGYGTNSADACYGPKPTGPWYNGSSTTGTATATNAYSVPTTFAPTTPCAVSFVAGFNNASLYPNQSHRRAWHDASGGFGASGGGPRHPEYSYTSPICHADGTTMSSNPLYTNPLDAGYNSGWSWSNSKPYQIEPTAADAGWGWGGGGGFGTGANFWDNGCDIQNFGIYVNFARRNRFHGYWADEVPSPNTTIEMMVKPEIDLWNWATRSKQHTVSAGWGSPYTIYPCSRQFLFEWGTGATFSNHGMNFRVACYVQLSRVYLEMYCAQDAKYYVMYADHQWKPHTWHHVEASWISAQKIMVGDPPVEVWVPHNAMLFADGVPASGILSGDPLGPDVNTKLGMAIYTCKAMVLPYMVQPTIPNNNVGSGPRLTIGSCLANDGSFGMSQPRFHGLIDNIVMHHWRSHDAAFTPRNRYHSVSYYDGATWKSGTGYKLEKAGVYKKRLTYLENECKTKDITIGTLTCTHYHPFHVHLYGHDGSAPTTSFGHITPALRMKSGGSYVDAYYYDGCAGLPIKAKVTPGSELYYMGWFEVASLVPVTMSPILCDITLTYFSEPVTYYRLSSSEAKK